MCHYCIHKSSRFVTSSLVSLQVFLEFAKMQVEEGQENGPHQPAECPVAINIGVVPEVDV